MDDNNYNVRIDDNFLRADFTDGQVLQHTDLNEFESVVKTAINANYEDIQKLQDGTVQIGSAETLNGASLSTYGDETLQNSDTKVPTSMQVKQYVDASLSAIDLSGYETKLEAAATVAIYDSTGNGIVDNAEKVNSHTVDKDVPSNAVFTDTIYDDTEVRGLIQTNTDNISSINSNLTNNYVTNTSLASTLTNYVKPTDYASSSKGGTIKSSSSYATSVLGDGSLTANNYTFSQYQSHGNNMFISKGTLENVITGKELTNKTYVDTGLAAKQGTLTAGSNITISDGTISATNTTYSNATTETAGLMSAADKTKLDSQIIEMTGTQESPINLYNLNAGIYKLSGKLVYYRNTNLDTLVNDDFTTLQNPELFIVSDWYAAKKNNDENMSLMSQYSNWSIDKFTEKQLYWVEKNQTIVLQKNNISATRAWYDKPFITDLTDMLNSPVLIWQNTSALYNTDFEGQTITLTQDYVKFLGNVFNNRSSNTIIDYNLFVEIVYASNITSNNAPLIVKSTGRLPISSVTSSINKKSINTIYAYLDFMDTEEVNSSYNIVQYARLAYLSFGSVDANNKATMSLTFTDCNKIYNGVSDLIVANKNVIPLYIYISLDKNSYKNMTAV